MKIHVGSDRSGIGVIPRGSPEDLEHFRALFKGRETSEGTMPLTIG